jgi:hypothetical protein
MIPHLIRFRIDNGERQTEVSKLCHFIQQLNTMVVILNDVGVEVIHLDFSGTNVMYQGLGGISTPLVPEVRPSPSNHNGGRKDAHHRGRKRQESGDRWSGSLSVLVN